MFAHKEGAQHGKDPSMGQDATIIYDDDKKAMTAVQQAINAAGYTPPVTVNGTFDAATQAGAQWLWTQGSSTPYSGHIDSEFLAAVGIDPVKGGFAGAAAFSVTKAPIPPGGETASSKKTILFGAGVGATFGCAFGGPIGAAVGGAAGAIGGVILGRLGV